MNKKSRRPEGRTMPKTIRDYAKELTRAGRPWPAWILSADDLDSPAPTWKHAIDRFINGNPASLAELIHADIEMPPESRAYLADALAGELQPVGQRKNASKLNEADKDHANRMMAHYRARRDHLLAAASEIADAEAMEPSAVVKAIRETYKDAVEQLAQELGVTASTLERYYRPKK